MKKTFEYNPSLVESKWPHKRLASPRGLRPRSRGASLRGKQEYKPNIIEKKWQEVWEKSGIFSPNLDKANKPFYNLMMFPYPSAEGLHVGNMYAFTGADIFGRFKRMQGFSVFEPIGLDGFGIHSENYAIKVGRHPKEQAKISQKNFYRQLRATGNAYDWSRTVETYDPDYYKWTQWIFIQLFKKGLAYRKKAPVNFCPSCKTVLSDEQVIDVKCERCSSIVEKRELEQWFFKITEYADRLLNGLTQIDWTEKVKVAQRNWIGKKEGIDITYQVIDTRSQLICWTSRPDTNFGATFIVLAPEHPLILKITKSQFKKEVDRYIKISQEKSDQDRIVEGREKTGVFTGSYAINNLTGEKMPIWVSDFVLIGFGTGAVVGVPGHDKRDFEFAQKFGLPVKRVVVGKDGDTLPITKIEQVQEEEGTMINSEFLNGMDIHKATTKIMDYLEEKEWGKRVTTYHLRDWLISRQRYWGPPIPMIYCGPPAGGCGWQPVPEEDLPVLLPDVKDWRPSGTGKSPLASVDSFVNIKCPNCGGAARRETDVSDTFLDSSWYFLRYLATEYKNAPFPIQQSKNGKLAQRARWLPVNMYIGGAEHSVLHLLYVRFLTMVFYDLGLVEFQEPFPHFYAHGLMISQGAKMSKSKGNVIIPDSYIKKYGADTLRAYLMFLGPFNQGGDFSDSGIEGMHRFLKRVWKLVADNVGPVTLAGPAACSSQGAFLTSLSAQGRSANADARLGSPLLASPAAGATRISDTNLRFMHKTIKKVTEDMESLRYNTAIAHIMEYYNSLHSFYTKYKIPFGLAQGGLNTNYCKTLVLLLAPFAPHMTEELWGQIRYFEVRSGLPAGKAGKLDIESLNPGNLDIKKSNNQVQESRISNIKNSKFDSIHLAPWPKYDPKLIEVEEATIVVQVNGKVREQLKIISEKLIDKDYVEQLARESANIKKHLAGKIINKVIYVQGKIINFVTE